MTVLDGDRRGDIGDWRGENPVEERGGEENGDIEGAELVFRDRCELGEGIETDKLMLANLSAEGNSRTIFKCQCEKCQKKEEKKKEQDSKYETLSLAKHGSEK